MSVAETTICRVEHELMMAAIVRVGELWYTRRVDADYAIDCVRNIVNEMRLQSELSKEETK